MRRDTKDLGVGSYIVECANECDTSWAGIELYDHSTDHWEYHNLADKPECVAAMKQLAAQLHAGPNALRKD